MSYGRQVGTNWDNQIASFSAVALRFSGEKCVVQAPSKLLAFDLAIEENGDSESSRILPAQLSPTSLGCQLSRLPPPTLLSRRYCDSSTQDSTH